MNTEHCWNDTNMAQSQYLKKNLSQFHFFYTDLTDWPGIIPRSLCTARQAKTGLSHGTAWTHTKMQKQARQESHKMKEMEDTGGYDDDDKEEEEALEL